MRYTTVFQKVKTNVYKCFLKTESQSDSRMVVGRLFQIVNAD